MTNFIENSRSFSSKAAIGYNNHSALPFPVYAKSPQYFIFNWNCESKMNN